MTDQLVALAREAEQLTKENIDLRHKLSSAESRLTQLEGAARAAVDCGIWAFRPSHHTEKGKCVPGLCRRCIIDAAEAKLRAALTPVVKQEEP